MEWIENFQKPDPGYSLLAFWFLNGELKEKDLRWQIGQMVKKGVYGGFLHPRAYLKTPYLEQEWWDAVGVCLDESRKKGFYPWLYDEYAWPSGTAGSTFEYGFQKPSRILAKGPENMAKGLYYKFYESEDLARLAEPEQEDDRLVAVAGKAGTYYAFFCRIFTKAVDYLNPETIGQFIKITHEEYKKRYGDDFGSLIPGIFFDEIFMVGNPVPWTEKLPKRFFKDYGYDLLKELPCLIEGTGEHERQVRRDYYSLLSDMYEEAFFKQISAWCEENKLKLTGHTEEFLWEHPIRQGNYFHTMRHLMIPGSDCHDYRYRYPRKITCCEPKYAVSVARGYGKERAMSEALGGAGWNSTPESFKKGINTLAAMGINLFVLHGFYYECEHQGSQSDWPTSFFYQNPYWKYFHLFSNYVQRISYMNTIGRPVVRCGILYPIEFMHCHMADGHEDAMGMDTSGRFHRVLNTMIEHQLDVDMVDTECVLRGVIRSGKLCVGLQQFELLLLPLTMELDKGMEEKLLLWKEQGGKIVFYKTSFHQELPEAFSSCSLCEPEEAAETVSGLIKPDVKISAGETDGIFVNHRIKDEMSYYFICNSSDEKRSLSLLFHEKEKPVLLDIETGEQKAAVCHLSAHGCQAALVLNANEAVYVLFGVPEQAMEAEDLKGTGSFKQEEWITGKWEFLPLSKEFDEKWSIYGEETELSIPIAGLSTDLSDDYRIIRICNTRDEPGNAGRHLSLWKASWITRRPSWNDQLAASDLYFSRQFTIDGSVKQADFCVAAIDYIQIYINGKQIFESASNGQPVTFSCRNELREGKNHIAVHVKNHNPLPDVYVCSAEELPKDRFISLLLQGKIVTSRGEQHLLSDENWLVNDVSDRDWVRNGDRIEAAAADFDVQKIKNFNHAQPDHLWIHAWERGKPPLKPWGDIPLLGEMVRYPVNLYYTISIPVGTVRIAKPETSGRAVCFLDGKEIQWETDELILKKSDRVRTLTLKVRAEKERDGLLRPVRVKVEPCRVNLKDWSSYGMPWFSGRCRYTSHFTAKLNARHYKLDLGKVNFCAEIWINRQLAAIRIWAPYCGDITEFIKEGENEIVIVAANLASNERRHMLVDEGEALGWNRYWNEDNMDRDSQNYVSGLLGPVRLMEEK